MHSNLIPPTGYVIVFEKEGFFFCLVERWILKGLFFADILEKSDIPDFARSMFFILVNLGVLDALLSRFV